MGLLGFFGSSNDPNKIREKILEIERKKAKVMENPLHSKDDLVNFDLKIRKLKEQLDELEKGHG